MNAVAETPIFLGYDPGTDAGSATLFTFICGDCGRTEHRPTTRLPEGWDRFTLYGDNRDLVRCPDCNEAIEQAKFAELQHRVCDYHEQIIPPPVAAITLSEEAAENYRAAMASQRPFSVFLEKQPCGEYRVAMTPEAALMRWLPLGFFLTPDQAETLAADLTRYADLARTPGTLPNSIGESQ